MMLLELSLRRIIIEVGLTAVNHGFDIQAKVIREALPYLIENRQAHCIIEATLLIGLGENSSAISLLKNNFSKEADMLRKLLDA
jgi:type III secretion system SsaH family protein